MCGGLPGFSGEPLFLFFGQGAEIFVFLWAFFRNGYSKMTASGAFLRQFAQEFFLWRLHTDENDLNALKTAAGEAIINLLGNVSGNVFCSDNAGGSEGEPV